jgi:hypothetical protein
MTFRKRGFRAMVLGLLVTAGLALAPAAFARGHIGIGISVPGVSVGYWGGNRGFVGVGGYGGYYGGYYAPAYYDDYYAPAYGVVYGGPVIRAGYPYHYYRGGYYRHDRGYYRRGYR